MLEAVNEEVNQSQNKMLPKLLSNVFGRFLLVETERLNVIYKELGVSFEILRPSGSWISFRSRKARIFIYHENKEIGFLEYTFSGNKLICVDAKDPRRPFATYFDGRFYHGVEPEKLLYKEKDRKVFLSEYFDELVKRRIKEEREKPEKVTFKLLKGGQHD